MVKQIINIICIPILYNILDEIKDNLPFQVANFNNDDRYAVKYADAVIQSYHPVKNITTGEGGSILTNFSEIHEKMSVT